MYKIFKLGKYSFRYKNIKLGLPMQSGMTLVELIVVLAIFLIVAGLTIFDYGRFRSSVSIQNLSDDIALSVRRTQNYAIGVQNTQSDFRDGYGIHFTTEVQTDIPLAGSNKSFIIFKDISSGTANKLYDYDNGSRSFNCDSSTLSAGNECLDLLTITSADEIVLLCPNSDPDKCTTGYTDIVFHRPNPDAYICVFDQRNGGFVDPGSGGGIVGVDGGGIVGVDGGGIVGVDDGGGGEKTPTCGSSLASVDIIVRNIPSQEIRTITVSNVGQISVK